MFSNTTCKMAWEIYNRGNGITTARVTGQVSIEWYRFNNIIIHVGSATVVNFSGHFTCCIAKHLNSRRCCYKCIWLGRWYKGSQEASNIKSHCCLSALFYTLLILPSVMCMYCLFMLHRIMSGYIFMLQGELSLNANFYLRDNSNRTVSFESVAFPSVFLAIQDGTTFLKEFSIFTVVRNSRSTW